MASYTTASNGQVILTSGAPLVIPAAQNIQGGLIEAASAKSIASQAAAASHYQNMGAGQKGAGRRTRKHKGKRKLKSRKVRRGGAQSLNMVPLGLPSAGSVPGVDADNVHLQAVDLKNQVSADKLYDHLRGATPIKLGGFRLRGAEDLYPGSGTEEDTKGRRKVNGRRGKRTHRRKRSKSAHRRSRKRRHI
jgi:hypothetical protein